MDTLNQWISALPLREDHKLVLAALAKHSDAEGVVELSGTEIAKAVGTSRRQAWRTVAYLERDGYIRRENRYGGNRNRLRNAYRIGPRPVDGSWLGGESPPPPRRPGRRSRR